MAGVNSSLLGVLVLTRHGDRQVFYQPDTYTALDTIITPLGEAEEFQLGGLLRSLYFDVNSTAYIEGIFPSTSAVNNTQVQLVADAGYEGGVTYKSALALSQGLWPATQASNITLANGTVVHSPLGGYQYVTIDSVMPDADVSLEGWMSCPNFDTATAQVYASSQFQQVASQNALFLASLADLVGGRPVTLQNIWNVRIRNAYNFMNVQYTYNPAFPGACPPSVLRKARQLANYHESAIFTSPTLNSIHNIPGQAILPRILDTLAQLANTSDPLKFESISLSYQPFLSLFSMMNISGSNANLSGIINFAGSATFEVRSINGSAPFVRFALKNGSEDATYASQPFFGGSSDIPLATLQTNLEPFTIRTLSSWCKTCGNKATRGCNLVTAAESGSHPSVSPLAAGFIGASVTLAFAVVILALMLLMGLVSVGRGRRVSASVRGVRGPRHPNALPLETPVKRVTSTDDATESWEGK
ncbi:hypothetical protein BS47DRAFT_1391038 [Hydnum rufescens UP504]|uniref:Histidine acid phosphatase n=1 Tax=Hydnum rufescens UP504 TaxID=1448309 RepID=A0A9P6B4G1_9AGAM|nr:hypothetical protein BS47DRAFT_1391038 [Hydnum rufescens UP504]